MKISSTMQRKGSGFKVSADQYTLRSQRRLARILSVVSKKMNLIRHAPCIRHNLASSCSSATIAPHLLKAPNGETFFAT